MTTTRTDQTELPAELQGELFLTHQETADFLGVTPAQLETMRRNGSAPGSTQLDADVILYWRVLAIKWKEDHEK